MIATKEQERKALQQIKKIVEGLGEGSYIGTAFEGCFEIAEDNIDNDFGNSMKDQRDWEAKQAYDLEKQMREKETLIKGQEKIIAEQNKTIEKLNAKVEEEHQRFHKMSDISSQHVDEIVKYQAENTALKQEVMMLKAKLYDFMVKEQ